MNLSFVHSSSVSLIGFLALLMSSLNYPFLAAETTPEMREKCTSPSAASFYTIGKVTFSFFVGALTSNRFLTVSRLHVGRSSGAPQIQAFDVDSTGTTELTKENSLKQSMPEDQIKLSLPVASGAGLDSEKLFFDVSGHSTANWKPVDR
jgi:hypothetical protein